MIYFLLMSITIASSIPSDHLSDLQALQRLLAQETTAHYSGNADLLVSPLSPKFIEISRGAAKSVAPDALRKRFQLYFSRVRVRHWDDVAPPQIAFAEDHTLATILEQKYVVVDMKDGTGSEVTHFAWLEVWRKERGRWTCAMIVSTDDGGKRN